MRKASEARPNLLLKREREQRNWSQADVAEKIGGDPKSVGRWERGITSPHLYYRNKLCKLFGKDAAELGLLQEQADGSDAEPVLSSLPAQHASSAPSVPPSGDATISVPLLWNVPYRRNPFYTGREDILTLLHSTLVSGKAAALTQPRAISGLGGIGKTQTAIEYAYRFRSDYEVVLWARADTRETLISDCVTIGDLLNLPEKDAQDQNRAVNAFKHWLETRPNWLLILDNADDLQMVGSFIPAMGCGHLLLTTREQVTGAIAQRIELKKMEPEEGTLFLLRRAKLIEPEAPFDTAPYTDQTRARAIVEAMDGLPLALDQAAAYIEETGCSLSGYLDLYRTRGAQLLKRRGRSASDHLEPVATTWSLSFERVAQANATAADLLQLCAFLHSDAIPEEIITEGASCLGPTLRPVADNPLLLDEALGELRKYSLVQRNAETRVLTIHRLVQEVLKEGMDEQRQRLWAERIVLAVNSAFPDGEEVDTWSRCQRCLSHAQVCAALIGRWEIVSPAAGRLLHQAGCYLYAHAHYEQAEPLYQRALAIRERVLGVDHPDTARSLHDLALLYYNQGKYEQAEPLYQRALAIWERVLGVDHPDTARSLNSLATLYREQGRYEQAELFYRRALTIWERVPRADHPDSARNLHDLAILYYNQSRYEQAEPLYQRALAIWERVLGGADHPGMARSLNSLATLYRDQGRYEQAEPLYQRALAIWERMLGGADHPDTARSLSSLATLYREQGKYEQAELLYQRALAIWERMLAGADHPGMARSLNGLATLYREQSRYEQAELLYQRALTIWERMLGVDHPDTARSLHDLAILYYHQGRYEQAEPLYQRALTIWERVAGANHPGMARSLNSLATLYREQGKYEQAELFYQRALTIWERVAGANHPGMARSLNSLATLYHEQGKYDQAELIYQQALAIWERVLGGADHRGVARSLNNLATLYCEQDKYEQAEPLYQRALAIREKILGPKHPEVIATRDNYATLLRKMNREAESAELEEQTKLRRQHQA